jgi:hypothetical protein
VLQLSDLPSAMPVRLQVTNRAHLDLNVTGRDGKAVRVEARFDDGAIDGWVPATDVERLAGAESQSITSELVRNTPVGPCRTYVAQSHPVSLRAGALVSAGPGKHPWAMVPRETKVWIADVAGPWVQVDSLAPSVWVRRSALIE